MKKILFFAIAILSLVHAQNTMSLNAVSGPANDTVTVSLSITNQDTVTGFQCDILLPDDVEFVENSATLSGREDDHVIMEDIDETNTLTLFSYSMSLTEYSGTSGEICSFRLILGTSPGTYALTLEDVAISDKNSQNIATGSSNGSVTIEAPDIYISPDSIAYGRVPLLDSLDRNFTIQNDGNTDLSVTNILSSHADFEVMGSTAFTLSPGSTGSVTVRFYSDVKGSYSENINILSDDPDEASLNVAVTSIAYAANELNISNMFARSGHTVTAHIDISNMEEFVAFSFDLDVPDVMTLVPGSAALSSRRTDHAVSASTLANGNIRIMAYSVSNDSFSGTSGEVLSFDLNVDGPGGYYNVTFVDPVIADSNSTNIISDHYNATLEIAAPDIGVSPGTLNFENVSIFDTATVNCTISNSGSDTLEVTHLIFYDEHFSSAQSLPFIIAPGAQQAVAVNFHNDIKQSHNSTMRIRSNDPDENPKDIVLSASSFIPNIMRVDTSEFIRNDTAWLEISIENHEDFVGFQCDLSYPADFMYLGNVELTERAGDHTISATEKDGNVIGLFSYSFSQTTFDGEDSAVVLLEFAAPSDTGNYDFTLSDVIIANAASENIMSSYEDGIATVENSAPQMGNFPDIRIHEDSDTLFNISSLVSDPNTDYDSLVWTFRGFDPCEYEVFGHNLMIAPEPDWFGMKEITAIISDGELCDSSDFTYTVFSVNDPPVWISLPDTSFNEDDSLKVRVSELLNFVEDPDNVPGDMVIDVMVPDVFHYGYIDSTLYLTADANWFGKDSIVLQASDGIDSAQVIWQITVDPVNDAPVFTELINTARSFAAETRDTIHFADLFEDIDTPDTSVVVSIAATNILYDVYQSAGFVELYINENITISETITITLNDGDNIVSDDLEIQIIEVSIRQIPETFALYPPYPNPFNPSTTIAYDIPVMSDVSIRIYNIKGRCVRTLTDSEQPAKSYCLVWNGRNNQGRILPSGMYIYRIVANSTDERYVDHRKMLFIK